MSVTRRPLTQAGRYKRRRPRRRHRPGRDPDPAAVLPSGSSVATRSRSPAGRKGRAYRQRSPVLSRHVAQRASPGGGRFRAEIGRRPRTGPAEAPVVRRQVVHPRLGPEFIQMSVTGSIQKKLGKSLCFALRVRHGVLVLVAEVDGAHRALAGAVRQLSFARHVGAEVALLDRADAARVPVLGRVPVAGLPEDRPGWPQLKLRAPYGQAAMQNRQPMHRSLSISTIPSSRLNVASTGQTFVQGGLSQW